MTEAISLGRITSAFSGLGFGRDGKNPTIVGFDDVFGQFDVKTLKSGQQ
jgi:hypothetical protein